MTQQFIAIVTFAIIVAVKNRIEFIAMVNMKNRLAAGI